MQASGDIHSDPVLREAMLALRIAHPNLVATYRANVRMLEESRMPADASAGSFHLKGDMTPSYQLFLLQVTADSVCSNAASHDVWLQGKGALSRHDVRGGTCNTPQQTHMTCVFAVV